MFIALVRFIFDILLLDLVIIAAGFCAILYVIAGLVKKPVFVAGYQ